MLVKADSMPLSTMPSPPLIAGTTSDVMASDAQSMFSRESPLFDVDVLEGFDDCDVALAQRSGPSRSPTPSMRESLQPSRSATPALPPPPLRNFSTLFETLNEDPAHGVPTPLECGIVAIGWGVSTSLARYFTGDTSEAMTVAGLIVVLSSQLAASVHGNAPYTDQYGSATPRGTAQVAVGYCAVSLLLGVGGHQAA